MLLLIYSALMHYILIRIFPKFTPPSPLPFHSLQKRAGPPGVSTEHNLTSYNKMRRTLSHQGWTKQPGIRKRDPRADTRVRDSLPLPLLKAPQEYQASNNYVCVEDLTPSQ